MPDDQEQQQTPPVNLADPAALTAAYQQYLQYLQQVGNQRPAQAPVISQAQLDANKPTSLLGQLGEALGGGAPSDVPMTSDQRERAGLRGLFNFSRGLLGTGTFDTIGQALARGETEAERGQYNQEAQVGYNQAAAQDWQRQQMADRLAALKESIPLLQGIQRLNMPSLYGPGGGPGSQAGGPGGGGVPGTPGAPGVATAFTGDKTKDLALIKQRESGGDYGIMNYVARADPSAIARGATASGAYQIVDSTWREGMQLAGLDPSKYAHAKDAPPGVQDQVASALYDKYGTRPWDPSKFGANWVQQPGGGYQLVKGAPYTPPTQVAQQPPAAPAQPAGKPPAPSGGTDTAALPVPPREPPGAVPTVTTPEQATATATAAGTPVQVPGGQGLYALPGGGVTSTPRLIMPGTDVASVTPTVPVTPTPAPPPGVVTPAPQQPAPTPTPTPQQPPAPTPAPASRAQDFSVADKDLTPEEYMDRHFVALTPEQVKTYAPGAVGDVAAAAADQVQRSKQQVAAAETQLDQIRRGIVQGDVNKAQGQVNDANKELDAAEDAYNKAVQDAAQAGAGRLLERDNAERTRVTGNYKADVIDPRNKAAELAQQGQQAIQLERAKGQTASEQKVMDSLNETQESARTGIDQLNLARQFSQASGDPGFWQMVQKSHPDFVQWAANVGAIPADQVQKLANTGAMDAAVNKLISMARTGSGFQRMTNLDVMILSSQAPQGTDPQAWREAKMAYLQTYMQHQMDYVDDVHARVASGDKLYDAQKNARMAQSDIVPQMDAKTAADPVARTAWAQRNVPPNTFFRAPDGQLVIYPGR